MLKPIHRVTCSPALAACQQLMKKFALWLCDPAITSVSVTQQGLQPPILATAIEANWLWNFLQRVEKQSTLLERAQIVANMSGQNKAALTNWVNSVALLTNQFSAVPGLWPTTKPIPEAEWKAFKVLLEAFYEKGFRSGLPFLPNGAPTVTGGVTYAKYVKDFRDAHRINPHSDAYEICVLCGDRLGDTPHVDHWIIKSAYPLLSMCQDNLTLICSVCNESPNKGDKPVHTVGNFADWFHPYLRPGNGTIQLTYDLPSLSVKCTTINTADQSKADNLDSLLNLTSRWTRSFKAKYTSHQDTLRRREQKKINNGQNRHTIEDIHSYIEQWKDDLNAREPQYEVLSVLAEALLQPDRLSAWHDELSYMT
ncbi:hypothetical protein J3L11_05630 [Shewanella sp. 4t3-1-2LB]|uniref:hypothetical protein n=1 Tax=Shewanella sp. 4t3-1-2LB TaxID=2817682 RepID=UPI001A9A1A32|nr:hypothetical protein [Shewanella sp. 4t3-1-2LB]MBO1271130.1 hypothetical protein [Shewanella sp. 4t3-1-2LB]